jgi:hypothetical protein
VQYLLNTQMEDGSWHVRSRAAGFQPYFDNLRCLPGDYQGERHIEIAHCLPDQKGQKWVEFTEVPGPPPNLPPQRPGLTRY